MPPPYHVYIVAGPNGSGKTTFAREFLPNFAKCPNFVNMDLIAHGLSPFDPTTVAMKAGRLVLSRIRELSAAGADFGFETTLSGRTHKRMFNTLRKKDYKLHLYYLWVPAKELSLLRIKNRVAEGGHDVLPVDVRRRFDRSIDNFFATYLPLADSWMLFDNSDLKPVLAAKGSNGKLEIENEPVYREITKDLAQ